MIKKSVSELGSLLCQVKGSSGSSAQAMQALKTSPEVAADADHILHPLMDLLDGKLSQFSQTCEKTVFKRLLKELWKIVMVTLEKTIVLPPMNEKNVILQSLPNAKIEDVGRLFKNNLSANRLGNLGVIEVCLFNFTSLSHESFFDSLCNLRGISIRDNVPCWTFPLRQ